jgi:anaerobic selenocysteine-containing dehydrogenase
MTAEEEVDRWVQSACVLCSNGCGMDIGVKDGRIVGVRGHAVDRVNHGRLGPKGLYGWQANDSADRLTRPLLRTPEGFKEVSWDHAMMLLVQHSKECIDKFTRESIAIYSTGQLFIEDYYTLAVMGKAGIGTSLMDGNTRLCTATAAAALLETFGSDGQPGSYTDLDTTDCIFMAGHNMSATQTVLWARILDRLAGPNPPKLVVLDPRVTPCAKEATVHLKGRIGANMAVLNGLQNLLIANGWIDEEYMFEPSTVRAFADIAQEAINHSFGTILVRGIFGGWLIAMIVWLLPFASSGRIGIIVIMTYAVGLGGMSHVIAGSIEVFTLSALGELSWVTALVNYTLPSLIGNTIGGVVLVALVNHAQVVAGNDEK